MCHASMVMVLLAPVMSFCDLMKIVGISVFQCLWGCFSVVVSFPSISLIQTLGQVGSLEGKERVASSRKRSTNPTSVNPSKAGIKQKQKRATNQQISSPFMWLYNVPPAKQFSRIQTWSA